MGIAPISIRCGTPDTHLSTKLLALLCVVASGNTLQVEKIMEQNAPQAGQTVTAERRGFLRRSLVVLGTAVAGGSLVRSFCGSARADQPATAPAEGQHLNVVTGKPVAPRNMDMRKGVPGRKWVMVIDLSKCDGCGHCQTACGKMHAIPADRQYIKVLKLQDAETTSPYFFPQPCYHCDNPPCTKVCPVDATFKREDGVVLLDNDRCIGCRFCMAACPYEARSFNWGHPNDPPAVAAQKYSPEDGLPRKIGTVEKCDFCPDMAANGMLPSCTSSCPMGVIYYGDQNEDAVTNGLGQTERFSKLIADRSGYRHLEELGTQPRVYYLPPKDRSYPAPPPDKKA
jgi:molybdopterin-containing oxidoreductase family iron-sulfur binding subunit